MLLQWHVKDPGHSAKSAGDRLHLNTHTPLTQQSQSGLTMLSKHSVGAYQGNKLTSNSSGNTQPQSSQLTEPLWTDPGLKSGIGVHKLISTEKHKMCRWGMNYHTFPPDPCKRGKKPHVAVDKLTASSQTKQTTHMTVLTSQKHILDHWPVL